MTAAPIDVTVIGGYLGAGKTTIVNHLLRSATQRLAVLVNDFGDIAIDADLIVDHDGTTMTLANGCICCSVSDGFVDTLDAVLGLDQQPERIIIECSGVADPATVAAHAHRPGLRLDGVVVVADIGDVQARARDRYVGDTVVRQLRSADLVLASKADLVSSAASAAATTWLRDIVGDVPIIEVHDGKVASEVVTGIADPTRHRNESSDHLPPDFASVSVAVDHPVDVDAVLRTLAELPPDVVRAKGVVRTTDGRWVAVHRAGTRVSTHALTAPPAAPVIVLLGRADALPDAGWLSNG